MHGHKRGALFPHTIVYRVRYKQIGRRQLEPSSRGTWGLHSHALLAFRPPFEFQVSFEPPEEASKKPQPFKNLKETSVFCVLAFSLPMGL